MTEYHEHGATLTQGQIQKFKKAQKSGSNVTVRISKTNLSGQTKLPLTKIQMNKIKKAKGGVQLTLSKAQLDHMEKTGGFLPLLALIPLIAGAVGAAGAATGGIAAAVSGVKSNNEQARHNRAIEEMTRETLKSGQGVLSDKINAIPIIGAPLSSILKKWGLGGCVDNITGLKIGNGVYLEPITGSGVFLGPRARD